MDEGLKLTDEDVVRMIDRSFPHVPGGDLEYLAGRGFTPFVEFKTVKWRREESVGDGGFTLTLSEEDGQWTAVDEIRPDDDVQRFAPESTLATLRGYGPTAREALMDVVRKLVSFKALLTTWGSKCPRK